MDPKNNDELLEEYEDALLRLMMNEYMEQEGNRLLQEMEELEAKGELPEVPPELDAQCRKLIADARENGRRKEMVMRVIKTAGRVAAILMITIGLLTSLVFSAEAARVPVLSFVLEQFEKFSAFQGITDDALTLEPNIKLINELVGRILDNRLPVGFTKTYSSYVEDESVMLIYKNNNNQKIIFCTYSSVADNLNIDTEYADCKNVDIGGFAGLLIKENSSISVYWNDSDIGLSYQLVTNNIDEEFVGDLAEEIQKQIKGAARK